MKVIYPDKITSISATNSADGFPVENLLDDYPSHIWKGVSQTETITLDVGPGANAVAMFNINDVDTVTIIVKDSYNNIVEEYNVDLRVIDTYEALTTDTPKIYKQFWISYTYQSIPHKIEMTLEAIAGSVPSAGIIRCGVAKTFPNPDWGLNLQWKDNSLVHKTISGRTYVVNRPKYKQYSGTIKLSFNDDLQYFMTLYLDLDYKPFAWLIADEVNDNHFTIFAKFADPPSTRYEFVNRNEINFVLEEVI